MQNSQLYLNNQPLDLPSDSLIALSYAVNTLTDLKTVQGNISNSISLPNTALNRAALGYPDDMNFNGAGIIRQKLSCRYVQNGVDVVAQGNLRVTGATKTAINVVISCGNTDFFDLITGKITDLDMREYDHVWNHTNVIASRSGQQAYVYPIINYGTLLPSGDENHSTGVFTNEMRPAVFARYLTQKIVQSAGYTLDDQAVIADDITRPIYTNLLLPFSGDKMVHPQRYIDAQKATDVYAKKITEQVYLDTTGSGTDTPLTTPQIEAGTNQANRFDGTYFTADERMVVDYAVSFDKIVSGTYNPDHRDGAKYELWKIEAATGAHTLINYNQTTISNDAPPQGSFPPSYQTTYNNHVVSVLNIALQPGDKLYLNIGQLYGCYQHIYPNVTLTIKRSTELIYGEHLQLEGTLPDMSCTDFLKFIQFYFCAIIQTDNIRKTVTIVPFGHIIQNMPLALDWSDKITNGDEEFDVQIGDYCQQNEAKWQPDDNISPDTYANGSFYLTDQNLDAYQDIYDLPFAPSYDVLSLASKLKTIAINKVPDIYAGNDFSIQTEKRVCLLTPTNTTLNYYETDGSSVTITDNIPLTMFSSGSPTVPDLTLTSIFNNHYKDLVAVLSDQRKLTCYMRLTEMDIQQLNFFIPIYIQKYASYFYISKITDFTGLKPVKVELIRLP